MLHASDEHFRLVALMYGIKNTWLSQIVSDMYLMWTINENIYTSMPDPSVDITPWLQIAANDSLRWNKFIRWHQHSMRKSRLCTVSPLPAVASQADTNSDLFICHCGKSVGSQVALHSHMRHKHGYINQYRSKIATSWCLCCRKEFHTSARLFTHVAYRASNCRKYYDANVEVVDGAVESLAVSVRESKAVSRDLLKPCIKPIPEDTYESVV